MDWDIPAEKNKMLIELSNKHKGVLADVCNYSFGKKNAKVLLIRAFCELISEMDGDILAVVCDTKGIKIAKISSNGVDISSSASDFDEIEVNLKYSEDVVNVKTKTVKNRIWSE